MDSTVSWILPRSGLDPVLPLAHPGLHPTAPGVGVWASLRNMATLLAAFCINVVSSPRKIVVTAPRDAAAEFRSVGLVLDVRVDREDEGRFAPFSGCL